MGLGPMLDEKNIIINHTKCFVEFINILRNLIPKKEKWGKVNCYQIISRGDGMGAITRLKRNPRKWVLDDANSVYIVCHARDGNNKLQSMSCGLDCRLKDMTNVNF